MTRFRRAARLIPACGLALALMVPAAGYAAPSPDAASYVQHDKGGGKGNGKGKAHGKQKAKAKKPKKHEQRVDAQRQVERQQQLQRQQRLERQRLLERQRSRTFRGDRFDTAWERQEAARRNRALAQRQRWPQSGNLADRPGRGIVNVQGEVTAEGIRCAAVRGDDGRLYTLVGDPALRLRPGDDVWIQGRVVQSSVCRQGTTLQIHQLRDLDRDGRWADDRRDDDWNDDWQRRDRLDRILGSDRVDDRWRDDRGELVNLRGRIATAGGCPVLRGDDGRTYELAGNLRGFGRGDSVHVIGVFEGGSRCGAGPSVRVGEIGRR
jgi:uncharacterized protein DUF5818